MCRWPANIFSHSSHYLVHPTTPKSWSWSWMIDSHPFCSMSITSHSWDIELNQDLYHMTPKGFIHTKLERSSLKMTPRAPFYKHGLTSIPAWISKHIHYEVWNEITYPFCNFKGATIEVWEWISDFIWEWISDFISHITGHVITYPCWD